MTPNHYLPKGGTTHVAIGAVTAQTSCWASSVSGAILGSCLAEITARVWLAGSRSTCLGSSATGLCFRQSPWCAFGTTSHLLFFEAVSVGYETCPLSRKGRLSSLRTICYGGHTAWERQCNIFHSLVHFCREACSTHTL